MGLSLHRHRKLQDEDLHVDIYIWSRVPCSHPPPWDGGVYDAPVVVYIHTYLHTYLPTYIRTYIHTYIPLHYLTLHYLTLPYITLPYIPYIHTITLHYLTLHYLTLPYITLPYIPYIHTYIYRHTHIHTYIHIQTHTHIHTYHYITLPYITLPYLTLPYLTFHTYIHTYIHTSIHTNIPTYQHTTTTGHRGGEDQKNHTTTTGHRGGTRRTIPPPQATGGGDQKNQTILSTHTHWWGGEGGWPTLHHIYTLINHLEYCGRIANLTVARTFMDVYGRTTRSYLLADMVSHCRCLRRWLLAAVQLRPGFARQRCHVTEREPTGIDRI